MGYFSATFILSTILVLKCLPSAEGAIKCYKCLVAPLYYTNESIRLCKDFDYSDKFIINCPYSTFCMKKIISAKIPDLINGTERDCASQKFETQNYYDHQWHQEVVIEEPYKEGCAQLNDKGARTTTTEFCYCKGDLCNFSNTLRHSRFHILATVIILTLKYFLC